MKNNFEEIKNKLKTISYNNNHKELQLDSTPCSFDSFDDRHFKSSEKGKMFDNKIEEVNTLGERLYEKLLEKV